jgi:hypothetical protein
LADKINSVRQNYSLGLDNLIERDMTSFEYYNSLPQSIKKRLESKDISSFEEMQHIVRDEIKNQDIF